MNTTKIKLKQENLKLRKHLTICQRENNNLKSQIINLKKRLEKLEQENLSTRREIAWSQGANIGP